LWIASHAKGEITLEVSVEVMVVSVKWWKSVTSPPTTFLSL
jgi:hypothetical protein